MSNLFTAAVQNLVTPQLRSGLTDGSSWPFFGFKLTEAGKKVNTHSALAISAFYCAVNTIANSFALLPHSVMIKTGNTREHFTDHPADYLLYREPNSQMTAFTFKFILAVSVLMKGNAYALIVRDNSGNIISYNFLEHDDVSVLESNGKLYYKYKNQVPYSASEILHIPGFSFDGITGKSIIHHAADNMGVSLAAQKFGSDSLQDRGISQGVIETDLAVKPEGKKRISEAWTAALSSGNKHRAAILDEGFKYKSLVLSPSDSKFIETYAASIEDIARWFQIPSYKLHIKGEGGYNFIVQLSIEYVQSAIMPFAEKFKQELERKSFTPSERKKGVYIFQNFKKLLQADPAARGQFYKDLVFVRAITPNEIRELEDMNPSDGGEEFLQMSNLLNESQIKKMISAEPKEKKQDEN